MKPYFQAQPWKAYYDEYGRLIGRTDYNAENKAVGIPDTHYHTYEWGPGKHLMNLEVILKENISHEKF